jgi:hypothetical protein
VFVPAGVVVHHGRALVIPGASFSGKTTLVAALVRAGATYYSDEYAVLDHSGRLHPYARRPLVDGPTRSPTQERGSDKSGTGEEHQGAELAAVVVTRYVPGATYQPAHATAGEGVLAMLAHTVAARVRPAECMAVLTRAAHCSAVLVGDRGDAEPAAAVLLSAISSPADADVIRS